MMFSLHLDGVFTFVVVYSGRFKGKLLCLSINCIEMEGLPGKDEAFVLRVGRDRFCWEVGGLLVNVSPSFGGRASRMVMAVREPQLDLGRETNLGRHRNNMSPAGRPHALLLSLGLRQGPCASVPNVGKTGARTLSILLRKRIRINTQLFDNLYFNQCVLYFL